MAVENGVSRPGLDPAAVRLLATKTIAICVLIGVVLVGPRLPHAILVAAVCFLVGVAVSPRIEHVVLFLVIGATFAASGFVRAFADNLSPFPLQAAAVQAMDRFVLGGHDVAWVQRVVGGLVGSRLDRPASFVYSSFFYIPLLTSLLAARRGTVYLRRFTVAFVVLWTIVLIGYWLVPTAPPWMSEPAVQRIQFAARLGGFPKDPNPVAAMPSMHVGMAVLCGLMIAELVPRLRVIAATVLGLAMAVSVVYLGEHYVVDAIAGVLVAFLAWRIRPAVEARMGGQPMRQE